MTNALNPAVPQNAEGGQIHLNLTAILSEQTIHIDW